MKTTTSALFYTFEPQITNDFTPVLHQSNKTNSVDAEDPSDINTNRHFSLAAGPCSPEVYGSAHISSVQSNCSIFPSFFVC